MSDQAALPALQALGRVRVAQTSSTAERVADAVREQAVEGLLMPGYRLPEQAFCEALGVSRNTLREAFSQLVSERILVREQHRGVFVTTPGIDDVRDVYRARGLIETAAIRDGVRARDPEAVAQLRAGVDEGREAAQGRRWDGVAGANQHFHRAVVALADSPRLDQQMDLLLAEMRLVFHRVGATEEFHTPYLERNAAVTDLVEAGRLDDAADELRRYLDDAERHILTALAGA